MAFITARTLRAHHHHRHRIWPSILEFSTISMNDSLQSVEKSVKLAVANRTYGQIPDILKPAEQSSKNRNPFAFLSSFDTIDRTRVIDDMLQSFMSVRPHTRLKVTYQYLLLHTLQSSKPFPITLAVLQRTLRSGCSPIPQTHLMLSRAWIDHRRECYSVPDILLDMNSIGYRPDSGTCNFIIKSLCNVDELEEAIEVQKGMLRAKCIPDVDSYSSVIAAFCQIRKTDKAIALMKEMVGKMELSPRQGMLVQLAAAFRANKEIWRAAEMIEFLERKASHVGFESYELVVEGCLECKEFILAGKMVMMMTDKGFIPYIKVRQKVVEGLASVGEWQLACTVRRRFAELNS
ncbi:pentatricopeptide repeat-containing protein At1g06270-like [Silene latifolia]|uniref:pentatricopeptide repeat-containing protein At1g06270-like n=1 Tax=Silene latifolia TaxID=37657 RepID=UPI003D77964F